MNENILIKDIKRINKIAIPILITYLTNIMFNLGDQAIIGRTSINGYTAISVVSNLLYAITGTLGIISLSLNIIGSKKLGQNDFKGYSNIFSTTITISLGIGIVFEIICVVFGKVILSKFYNMSGEVLQYGYIYLAISGLSILLNTLMFIYSSYFKSIEKTSILYKASIISSIVNIAIDYVLVFGKLGFPKLGVAGAAIGSVVGLLINTLIYLIAFKKYSNFKYSFMLKLDTIIMILRSYIPLLGQDLIESTAFIFVITAIITKLGTVSTGAYNLISVILSIIILPIYAYGNAIITIVAKSTSENTIKFMSRIPLIAIAIVFVITFPFCMIMLIKPSLTFGIITNEALLIKTAMNSFFFGLLIQVPNIVNHIYKYSLNALEDSKWVLFYHSIIGAFSLILIYNFSINFTNGIFGIFLGLGLNYILLATGFYIRYSYIIKKDFSSVKQNLPEVKDL